MLLLTDFPRSLFVEKYSDVAVLSLEVNSKLHKLSAKVYSTIKFLTTSGSVLCTGARPIYLSVKVGTCLCLYRCLTYLSICPGGNLPGSVICTGARPIYLSVQVGTCLGLYSAEVDDQSICPGGNLPGSVLCTGA